MLLRLAIVSLLVISGVACKHNKRANTTVRERAAFDLLCDPNELKLGVIDTEGARKLVSQIAVYGCDKKAVYVYYPDADTWVIDGAITEVPEDFKMEERSGESRNKKSKRKAQKAEKKGKMDSGY
ncbi:MAG TPA: hypothetical protein VFG22_02660 [Polyangiales bacterium]|nr:hypothetical protein [Polyangiales bacterium]